MGGLAEIPVASTVRASPRRLSRPLHSSIFDAIRAVSGDDRVLPYADHSRSGWSWTDRSGPLTQGTSQ
jgi:hypothetical protein